MSRTRNHPTKPVRSCKKHPGVPALPGKDVCASCDYYEKLAPKVMGTAAKPKK